jgi:hypothetical protein
MTKFDEIIMVIIIVDDDDNDQDGPQNIGLVQTLDAADSLR